MTASRLFGGPEPGSARSTDSFDTVLEPARIRFRSLIVARVLAFEAYGKLAAGGEDSRQALTGISDLAHKISGVSATLGFATLGALAAALERTIAAGSANHDDPAHFQTIIEPRLEALLDEMESLLDA